MVNDIIHPSHNFVAIDVEYADTKQNICQIGIAIESDSDLSLVTCEKAVPQKLKKQNFLYIYQRPFVYTYQRNNRCKRVVSVNEILKCC